MSVKYKINKGFIYKKIGDQITIFSGEDSLLFTLNETAAYIFRAVRLGKENEVIALGIEKKFGATKQQAGKDLKAFLELLLKKKIITEVK